MNRSTIACLLVMGISAGVFGQQEPATKGDDLASELPRIAATEPAEALEGFVIREGFSLLPAAVEPRVADPVSACYDADGRLYVVEMRGYPFPEPRPTGKVRLLVDNDGDGLFESSTVFLDDLNWPTSVVPYDGGVFVMAPPDLYFARDDDGDGKADTKRVMFRGFGTQNVQALANGLLWGPDGWIYGVGAGNGGEIENLTRPTAEKVSIRGRDFRFLPDGGMFEAINGGGQFGHAFDDWGHRFTCANSNHIRQIVFPTDELARNRVLGGVPVTTDIGVEGAAAPVFRISGAEPWRIVRTRQRAADPDFRRRLPPTELVATGFFTSATGVTIYRGSAYPEPFRGNAFIGDVGGNLVHRKRLEPDGAIYRAVRTEPGREFLASPDNWFRPVNFTNTPWGTLLLLDMYRETIEHPLSIPEPIKQHLDLVSGKDRGRLYEIVPEGFERRGAPGLSGASLAALVGHLGDADAWWRETAQRLLIERRDGDCVEPLRSVVKKPGNSLARLHAIWTLGALDALEPSDVMAGLGDEMAGVREASCRVVLGHPEVAAEGRVSARLVEMADDPDAMVRFAVALALGEVSGPSAVEGLAAIAFRDAGDRWTRAAVQSSLGRRVEAGELLARLNGREGFLEVQPGKAWTDELAALIGAEGEQEKISKLLVYLAGEGSSPRVRRAVVLGLGRGLGRSGRTLASVAVSGQAGEVFEGLLDEAQRELESGEGDQGQAISGIELLAQGDPGRVLSVLPAMLEARRPAAVQLAALKALGGLKDPAVAAEITSRWQMLGPAARAEATEVLLSRPERVRALLEAVAAGSIAGAELDPARKEQLLTHPNTEIKARAKAVLGDQSRPSRAAVLASFAPALTLPAKAERGKEVYLKVCATCHQAEGQGVAVGPDLATVANRTPEDLLMHIMDPNREVAPVYLNYTVATTDGRVLSGMIAEETANAVTLKRAQGLADVVPRDQIEEMRSTGLSLMPENMETLLDPQGLADLISYVQGMKAAN